MFQARLRHWSRQMPLKANALDCKLVGTFEASSGNQACGPDLPESQFCFRLRRDLNTHA